VLTLLFAILFFSFASTSLHAATKPNILLLIADDYGVDSSSLYNSTNATTTLAPTPNIASLASNGVVFSRAVSYPVCSPTRACLLTGQYGFRTGIGDIVDNGSPLAATAFTLPKAFTNAPTGYALAQFGKWHLAFGQNTPRTVGGWTNFSGFIAGAVPNYTNWTKVVNNVATANYTNYTTTDLVNDATNWIAARGTNAWFVWAAFNAPHTPLQNPPQNLCPSYPLNTLTNSRRQFEAMTEALDTEIGRLLTAVNRTNTHIIFLGDNGTLGSVIAPPYSSTRAKDTLYQGGTHVPLIISSPLVAQPNRTNATPANMVDIFATILEMAGTSVAAAVPSTNPIDGQSLVSALTATNTLTRYAYAELFGTNAQTVANGGRALQNSQFKLIAFTDGHKEFYDLNADPLELTNLVNTTMTATQSGNYYALTMKLGDYQTALAAPVITNFAKTNAQFTVTVTRNATNSYALWRATSLDGLSWSPLTNALVITNVSLVALTDTNTPSSASFYRVVASSP
jgi:arylsulfatase A-like enzyme